MTSTKRKKINVPKNNSLTNDNDTTVRLLKRLANLGKPLTDKMEDVDEPAGAPTENQTN